MQDLTLGVSGGAAYVDQIRFQDNNGQRAGSTYIGWGVSPIYGSPYQYGIDEFC